MERSRSNSLSIPRHSSLNRGSNLKSSTPPSHRGRLSPPTISEFRREQSLKFSRSSDDGLRDDGPGDLRYEMGDFSSRASPSMSPERRPITAPTATTVVRRNDTISSRDTRVTSSSSENLEPMPFAPPTPAANASSSQKRMDSDNWSETDTIVPRRNLTVWDVAALIFNKMVGTGIFTTPGTVLLYTKSKPVSLVLWGVGGIYTSLFILIYLEFGNALPFTGGELIYLDEVFPDPELLSTILFSGFFLVLGNSYGNSITFAKYVLLAANPEFDKSTVLDGRLVRFLGIVIMSFVCLLHYFSRKFGLFLNKLLAVYKGILLFVVFVAGVKASKKEDSGLDHFSRKEGEGAGMSSLAALVLILYAYQGWENANYVAGEIRAPGRTLKIGAFLAVGMVSILYMLVTLAYYLACDYASITSGQSDLGMAVYFAPKVFGSPTAFKICIALSAFGNLVAVTFTSAKVKQAIAIQRILPFYKFFSEDLKTPKGALTLHWLTTMVLIVAVPVTVDGYSFAVGLFTYGHVIFSIIVTAGLYRLQKRMRQLHPDYRREIFTNKHVYRYLPLTFIGMNIVVLIWGARPRDKGSIPRFWWPVAFFLIMAGSFLYWGVLRLMQVRRKGRNGEKYTIGSVVGFEVKIYNETDPTVPDDMAQDMVQSRYDGSRRRVGYTFSGPLQKIGRGFRGVLDFFNDWVW